MPFDVTKENQNFALDITVKGGGLKGQVDAIQLGISRALSEIEALSNGTKHMDFLPAILE